MHITTKPPIRFYVWSAASIIFSSYLFFAGMVLWGAVFYGLFGVAFLYWVTSGKDCCITLGDESIKIKFNKTFWKTKTLPLHDVLDVEFIKGDPAWKLMFVTSKIEKHYRALDKLILIRKTVCEEVLINTNRADLQLLISHFQRRKK